MRRRFVHWLVAYAASMTLLAAWFGSRMVVYGALLGRTTRFLVSRDSPTAEGWAYHYDPEVLAERGFGYACVVVISKASTPLLIVAIAMIFFACWLLSRPRHGQISYHKTASDLSLE